MVRRYTSSFQQTWAVTGAAPSTRQPQQTQPSVPGKEIDSSTEKDFIKPSDGEENDDSSLSIESKTSTVRIYSKAFPSSWVLPNDQDASTTQVVDFQYEKPQDDAAPLAEKAYYKQSQPPRPDSSERRRPNFSAESGFSDAPPRPPEAYVAKSYSATSNCVSSAESPPRLWSYDNVPNPPLTTLPPNIPWNNGTLWSSATGQDHSSKGPDVPLYVSASRSSGADEVPARAPHVSSRYSKNI